VAECSGTERTRKSGQPISIRRQCGKSAGHDRPRFRRRGGYWHDGLALPDVLPDLAAALALNPNLRVLSLNGYLVEHGAQLE